MIGWIGDLFATPEAQADAYTWAAVALAHAGIGAVLVAVAACLPLLRRHPVLAASLGYGLLWEGGQLLFAGGGLADGVLDWVAVTLGAIAGAAAWSRQGRRLAAVIMAIGVTLWTGVRTRK